MVIFVLVAVISSTINIVVIFIINESVVMTITNNRLKGFSFV